MDYWGRCGQPLHVTLAAIARRLGIEMGVASSSSPAASPKREFSKELTPAERWAEHGYMPGLGSIETKQFDELPPTVRKFVLDNRKQS